MARTSARWRQPPSQYLGIADEYTAFCLDSAADYLLTRIETGDKPAYLEEAERLSDDERHKRSLEKAWNRLKHLKKKEP